MTGADTKPGSDLLTSLLRDVSRSFYITLRFLPHSIRRQIGLAYLLARTTDTVADTEIIRTDHRLELLRDLQKRIEGKSDAPLALALGELAAHQGNPAEKVLLQRVEESLAVLQTLSPPDQGLVREVLHTIITGQRTDLERFRDASATNVVSLTLSEDLTTYTYRVAGCVGEFWTKMCRAHLFPEEALDETWLLKQGVKFGNGLQLVNILRDLPRDLRQGRCYIPSSLLKTVNLKPTDLLDPAREREFRFVYNRLLSITEMLLWHGWEYTLALPPVPGTARVRLACCWPILIGLKTVEHLWKEPVLDPAHRVKATRGEVRWIMFKSLALYPAGPLWKRLVRPRANSETLSDLIY